jgi:hypothetical protein
MPIVAAIDWEIRKRRHRGVRRHGVRRLDGRVARWTHTESAFGKEYDSLSDMVSFGLAPAIVTYQWGVARIAEYGPLWRRLGWLVCFFYAAAAALRLARFNSRRRSGQALLRGSAESVRRRHRRGLRVACERPDQHRLPGSSGLRGHRLAGALMISRFAFQQLQAGESRRPRALHAHRARAARLRAHLFASADGVAAPVRRVCAVGADGVGLYRKLRRRRTPGRPRA